VGLGGNESGSNSLGREIVIIIIDHELQHYWNRSHEEPRCIRDISRMIGKGQLQELNIKKAIMASAKVNTFKECCTFCIRDEAWNQNQMNNYKKRESIQGSRNRVVVVMGVGWVDARMYPLNSRRLVLESSVMVITFDVLMLYYGTSCGKSFGVLQSVVWVHLVMGRRWLAGLSGRTWNNLVKQDTAVKDMVRTHSESNSDTGFELAVVDLPPTGKNRERQDLIVIGSLGTLQTSFSPPALSISTRESRINDAGMMVSLKIDFIPIDGTCGGEHIARIRSEQLICVGRIREVMVSQNHKGITHPCTFSCLIIMGMLLVSFKWVLVSTVVESDKRCASEVSRLRLVCSRTCTTNRPHRDSGLLLTFLSLMFYFTGIDEIVIEGGLGVGCEPVKHMKADFFTRTDQSHQQKSIGYSSHSII
jgi:hypothetical protein